MSKSFVLDASLAISWCIEKEQTAATEEILDSFVKGHTAVVPALWVWEINNVLVAVQRARRLDDSGRRQKIALLNKLPIDVEEDAQKQAWNDTASLACSYGLSVYDAAYLELALRRRLPLGTLDRGLRSAAKKSGISCLPEKS